MENRTFVWYNLDGGVRRSQNLVHKGAGSVEFLDPIQVLEVIKNLRAFVSLIYASWSLWDKVRSLSRRRTKACKKIQ